MTFYGENATSVVQEIIEMSEKNRKEMQEAADKERADNISGILNKRFYLTQTYMESRFEAIFLILRSLMSSVNAINSALDKLPKRQEFEEVKAELDKQVNETLKPSQEDLEKLKEVVKRGEKGVMYG